MGGPQNRASDPLIGPDPTAGDLAGSLPGFVLPALDLPTIAPDGTVRGVAGGEDPDGAPQDRTFGQADGAPRFSAGDGNSDGAPADRTVDAEADAAPRARTVGEEAVRRGLVSAPVTRPPAARLGGGPPIPHRGARASPSEEWEDPPRPPPADGRLLGARPLAHQVRQTVPPSRPRIEAEPAILGLSRHSRSRLGSRLFTLFFVVVFGVIVIQLLVSLLGG